MQILAGLGVGVAVGLSGCAGGGAGSRPSSAPVPARELKRVASEGLLALAPSLTGGRHRAFKRYDRDGKATWADGGVRTIDLSGVAFDNDRTATLIAPRHVLMSKHFGRKVGTRMVFHDRSGRPHEGFVVASRSGPNDIAVGQLNRPMPVRPYRVLSARADYGSLLRRVPVVLTNRKGYVFCHEVAAITPGGWASFGPGQVPGVAGKLVVGDSGNPGFLLINGEPILIETHTLGGFGAGPFVSDPANFAAINRLMGELGSGERLSVLEVR